MKEFFLPPAYFDDLNEFAQKENLPELQAIVNKHQNGIILLSTWEVEILLNVAKLWRLQAKLRYPFWDSGHPKYNTEHEDLFFDAQDEKWGKIAMTFSSTEESSDIE